MARIIDNLLAHLPKPLAGITAAYLRPYENALASQIRTNEWFIAETTNQAMPTRVEVRLEACGGSFILTEVRYPGNTRDSWSYIISLDDLENPDFLYGQFDPSIALRRLLNGRIGNNASSLSIEWALTSQMTCWPALNLKI